MEREIFVLTTEAPTRPGGVERFLGYLVEELGRRGYGVRVFHRENCAPARWRSPRPERPLEWLLGGILQGYYIGRAARRALHPGVELVISNSTVGWYPLGGGVLQAHYHHGTYRGQAAAIRPFISGRGYHKLTWWDSMVLERLSGRGKIGLTNSDQTREEVRRYFGQDPTVIGYPLDTGHFRPLDRAECRAELGLPADARVGLYVGSVHPQKGFPVVRHLVEATPGAVWLLALRGDVPPELERHEGVRVFQNAGYDRLPTLYNAADVFVAPSRYEPFGLVVAEALACGTPVIATPGGASRMFLEGSALDPLLIRDLGDVAGFQAAVERVFADPAAFRRAATDELRPAVDARMGLRPWWDRFFELTGVPAAAGVAA